MSIYVLLTCEHAGNMIPEEYDYLFFGEEEVLYTHEAIDFGALDGAKYFSSKLGIDLHYTSVSRLLVEANRATENPDIFSEFVRNESEEFKERILENYYWPHRSAVEELVRKATAKGQLVVHLAIHSFAPVIHGEVRRTDVGIQFDPSRRYESMFADQLQKNFQATNRNRKVHLNEPYPGTNDCLPRYLRQRFSPVEYVGIEVELNQKFFLNGEPTVWDTLLEEVCEALSRTYNGFLPKTFSYQSGQTDQI